MRYVLWRKMLTMSKRTTPQTTWQSCLRIFKLKIFRQFHFVTRKISWQPATSWYEKGRHDSSWHVFMRHTSVSIQLTMGKRWHLDFKMICLEGRRLKLKFWAGYKWSLRFLQFETFIKASTISKTNLIRLKFVFN